MENERRKRLKRPRGLVIIAVLLILQPAINVLSASLRPGGSLENLPQLLGSFSTVGMLLMYLSPIVGVGLLITSRWSWYAMLAYAALVIGYNVHHLAVEPTQYSAGFLLRSLIGFGIAVYVLRRDIYAPYLGLFERGWRGGRRIPASVHLLVNGEERKLLDISRRGCFVEWPDFSGEAGDRVNIEIEAGGLSFKIEGGVVRISENGVGVAFRGLTRELKAGLETQLAGA